LTKKFDQLAAEVSLEKRKNYLKLRGEEMTTSTSLFLGLEIAKRGVMVHQTALDITGHNIANVNTPGYSRQVGNMVTNRPWHSPSMNGARIGQVGTGVDMQSINRIRDAFIDAQIRNEARTTGYWTGIYEGMTQVESIINEPSEEGLRAVLDQFWAAWQDVTVNPENNSTRAVVVQRGMALSDTFKHMYSQYRALQYDLNDTVAIKVDEINVLAQSIADLNYQIKVVEGAGKIPNDLYDRRDLLLDDLSSIIDIKAGFDISGNLFVQSGGRTLVQGIDVSKLAVKTDADGMHMVIWADSEVRTLIRSGELKGLLDMRGKTSLAEEEYVTDYREILPTLIDELNMMAKTIVERTNELHRGGYSLNNKTPYPDGIDFFQIPDASQAAVKNWAQYIIVSGDLQLDPNLVAASQYATWNLAGAKSNFGDNFVALAIAQLKHDLNSPAQEYITDHITLTFPYNGGADVTINYNDLSGAAQTKAVTVPYGTYLSLAEYANALQTALQADPDLSANNITIKVRCNGDRLVLSSLNADFTGAEDVAEVTGALTRYWPTITSNLKGDYTGATTPPGIVGDLRLDPTTGHIWSWSVNRLAWVDIGNAFVQNATTDDFWRGLAAQVGIDTQEAERMLKNQEILMVELENKRQSVMGTSLDEEMTFMIKFQHAYNASARFLTTIDEELDVVINKMGLVGR
jgi:flagellar hook-associated protein 1 FlgK